MFLILLAAILSIEADFTQTKEVALLNEPQVSTGHMTYRAPDYLQWAYQTPQPLIWEIDGEQSNVSSQIQGLMKMIMASIAGQNTENPKMQRAYKRLFRSVEIEMDEQNEVAKKVQLVEKNGDITTIEFTNVITK